MRAIEELEDRYLFGGQPHTSVLDPVVQQLLSGVERVSPNRKDSLVATFEYAQLSA
jgi:hypothetical protein